MKSTPFLLFCKNDIALNTSIYKCLERDYTSRLLLEAMLVSRQCINWKSIQGAFHKAFVIYIF